MHSMHLQAAQRRALDVINSIGLSDSLLRVIDRRQRMDRWIVYGGMVRCPAYDKQTCPPKSERGADVCGHCCTECTLSDPLSWA